jgi:hypothetical protein
LLEQYGPELLPHLEEAEAMQTQRASLGAEDPRMRSAQLDALTQLQDVYAQGGMTEADRAAMSLANDAVSGRANQDAAEAAHAMQQRGLVNSGLGYAMNVAGQQNAATALGQMSRQNQVDARSRALQALSQGANLAGNIRGDDFRWNEAQASAQDRINMFNAQQQADTQRYNLGLAQQQFDNQMMLNQARGQAANGVAGGYERGAQATRETGAGVGNALLTYGMWGEKQKEKK